MHLKKETEIFNTQGAGSVAFSLGAIELSGKGKENSHWRALHPLCFLPLAIEKNSGIQGAGSVALSLGAI